MFNTEIALGALTGGRAAEALGPTAVPGVGGCPALLALPAVVRAGLPGTGATRRPDPAGPEGMGEQV
ncbi:hypothetical protein ACH49O_01990 [Streptomyces coeruleorubidus]|uniref:hypothetical protein n=1 Tax=Streptomyces coeruleorubidus TaxID=116188 RepID=UPI0033EB2D0D